MNGKVALIIILSFFLWGFAMEKPKPDDKINWLSLSEVQEKLKTQPKPVLIDLYTNWCYWCKVMDNRTYQNKKVVGYINENFYAVKVNAETKDSLKWNRKIYTYNPNYKVNSFAIFASGGKRIQFPTTIIFTDSDNPIAIPGYLRTGDIESFLKYFGGHVYEKMSYPDFMKSYKNEW